MKAPPLGNKRCWRHGLKGTPEYAAWHSMKSRCLNPKHPWFHRYGGRGVTICPRWLNDPAMFVADVGFRPSSSHSLDRIDNDGNYEPSNVRWSTVREQTNNRRSNVVVNRNGETKTLAQWIELSGLPSRLVRCRIDLGWSIEDALTRRPRKSPNREKL